MRSIYLDEHRCESYCHDGEHARVLWVETRGRSTPDVAAWMKAHLRGFGIALLGFREVWEATTNGPNGWFDQNGSAYSVFDLSKDARAFLVWYRDARAQRCD